MRSFVSKAWLLSVNKMVFRFNYTVSNDRMKLFSVVLTPTAHTHASLCIWIINSHNRSSVSTFQPLDTIIDSTSWLLWIALKQATGCRCLWTTCAVSHDYVHASGIARWHGSSSFNILRNLGSDVHSGRTILANLCNDLLPHVFIVICYL